MLKALLLSLAALATAIPTPVRADDALPPPVRAALRQAAVPETALAAIALPLGHRGRTWRYQADKPMQPASTMKLVTSVVALDRLRATHRGYTEFRSAAPLVDGVLQGDLLLVGGADPDLSVPVFWALLQDLRARGVHSIQGDLVVDRNRFYPPRIDQNLPPFDEAPLSPYNVIPDALLLGGALLQLALQSDGSDAVRATTVPPLAGIVFDNRMSLADQPCEDWDEDAMSATVTQAIDDGSAGVTRVELRGPFPRNCTQRVALQLIDRQELTARLFASLWQGMGGVWNGRARSAAESTASPRAASDPVSTSTPMRVLARHSARPWGEVLRPMNKQSDNAITRLLFLELGAVASTPGASTPTLQQAKAEVQRWFTAHRIDIRGLVLDNGSGLSRSERITPRQLASMLRAAWSDPQAPDLLASLPVAGVDGTMRRRLKASPAAGVARLKSGTLRDVTAVAGVVADAQGRPWAVAAMVNVDNAARARTALDALVDGIARFGPHGQQPMRVGPLGNGP